MGKLALSEERTCRLTLLLPKKPHILRQADSLTAAFKVSLLSRPLLRSDQGDELRGPRNEFPIFPGGKSTGQASRRLQGLLTFHLTLVWCDQTSREEVFL